MSRARRAVEDVLQVGRLDHVGLRRRINLFFVGDEHDVNARRAQLLAIRLQRTRVALEILLGAELQPIDENAHHRARSARLGEIDQLDVASVQIAHRRHEHVVRLALQAFAQGGDRMDDVHVESRIEERGLRERYSNPIQAAGIDASTKAPSSLSDWS